MKIPIYTMGSWDPVEFLDAKSPQQLEQEYQAYKQTLVVSPNHTVFGGVDTRVYVDEKLVGTVQAVSYYREGDRETLDITGLFFASMGALCDIPDLWEEKTIRVTCENEFETKADIINNRLIDRVLSFATATSVDDMTIEYKLSCRLVKVGRPNA